MIRVEGLTKSFDGCLALRGLDLDVAEGECVAIVGPNGAGKTTLLRIIAGLSRPTRGSVHVAGLDLARAADPIRRRVGFLSHRPLLYGDLSAEENLRFYGSMYDVANLDVRIGELLAQVGLASRRHDLVRAYSRGMRQRLAIARALLHNPPVLLLDEPYTGLDQQATEMLNALLRKVGPTSRTVLLTTHNLEQGLRLSRRSAILVNGQIRYQMAEKNWDMDRFQQEYRKQMTTGGGQSNELP